MILSNMQVKNKVRWKGLDDTKEYREDAQLNPQYNRSTIRLPKAKPVLFFDTRHRILSNYNYLTNIEYYLRHVKKYLMHI